MNQFNNDTLKPQQKIVGIKIPDEAENITAIIEYVATALKCLYGIIFLLKKEEKILVVINPQVKKETITFAQKLLESENLENEIEIIPFPKK